MEENKQATPDALSPEALREEIALIIKHQYLTVSTNVRRAHETADLIIAKLMLFYEAAATPEVTEDAIAVVTALQAHAHAVDGAIQAGADMAGTLAGEDPLRKRWITAAIRLRDSSAKVLELLT